MNINSCTSNTRTDVNCAYNLDCSNGIKQNHIQSPCPAPEQPILNCDPNKPCPVYIRKDEPDLLYKRQFPDKPCPIIPGYRGSYKVCGLYTTEINKPKSNLKNHMKVVHHPKGSLYPGNGCGVEFLKNIDIDTELRRGKNHSECRINNYRTTNCENTVVSDPTLLHFPSCENNKYYEFYDDMGYEQLKCTKPRQLISKDTSKKYRLDLKDINLINFNYAQNEQTCMTDPLNPAPTLSNLKQPLLFQNNDSENNSFLQVGPDRQTHTLENIWNNVTKRKYI